MMLFLLALVAASWPGLVLAEATDKQHVSANHIFNAIHSATRQWGSSLNHNGMSFFLVMVPEGTHFYHGRATNETVTGMEWAAFEPEHALVFARQFRERPRYGHALPKREPWESPRALWSRVNRQDATHAFVDHADPRRSTTQSGARFIGRQIQGQAANPQQPLQDQSEIDDVNDDVNDGGYLHTLAAKRDLRLLYIDGMAAGKCDKGTLDSTDYVLLNRSTDGDGFAGPIGGDLARAHSLCDLARDQWHGRIDGFLRMEAGFEIIVCSFEDSMTELSVRRTKRDRGPRVWADSFGAYMKAVSSRYDGLGGHRVAVNFETMVTAFDYPIDLFAPGKLPRLKSVGQPARTNILADVEALILKKNMPPRDWIDWQAIADMIVGRWGKEVAHLQSYNFTSLEEMTSELEQMYRPFIDYDHRSAAAEIQQCSLQFMPHKYHTSVASSAIRTVARKICHSLHTVLQQSEMATAQDVLTDLVEYLQWPMWKRCTGCLDNEVCFLPFWPFGSTQDHESPSCLTAEVMQERHGYWDVSHSEQQ